MMQTSERRPSPDQQPLWKLKNLYSSVCFKRCICTSYLNHSTTFSFYHSDKYLPSSSLEHDYPYVWIYVPKSWGIS